LTYLLFLLWFKYNHIHRMFQSSNSLPIILPCIIKEKSQFPSVFYLIKASHIMTSLTNY
jgi:hypothetical protein